MREEILKNSSHLQDFQEEISQLHIIAEKLDEIDRKFNGNLTHNHSSRKSCSEVNDPNGKGSNSNKKRNKNRK